MSEDAERNAFEGLPEFVADQALLQRQWDGKSYVYTRVQGMWDGWQAKAAQAETAQAAPAGYALVPVEPTHQMGKAAADAWLDCGSKLFLNKAAAAVRAGIAAATPGATHGN